MLWGAMWAPQRDVGRSGRGSGSGRVKTAGRGWGGVARAGLAARAGQVGMWVGGVDWGGADGGGVRDGGVGGRGGAGMLLQFRVVQDGCLREGGSERERERRTRREDKGDGGWMGGEEERR